MQTHSQTQGGPQGILDEKRRKGWEEEGLGGGIFYFYFVVVVTVGFFFHVSVLALWSILEEHFHLRQSMIA